MNKGKALLQNELYKTFHRKGAWVAGFLILVVMLLGLGFQWMNADTARRNESQTLEAALTTDANTLDYLKQDLTDLEKSGSKEEKDARLHDLQLTYRIRELFYRKKVVMDYPLSRLLYSYAREALDDREPGSLVFSEEGRKRLDTELQNTLQTDLRAAFAAYESCLQQENYEDATAESIKNTRLQIVRMVREGGVRPVADRPREDLRLMGAIGAYETLRASLDLGIVTGSVDLPILKVPQLSLQHGTQVTEELRPWLNAAIGYQERVVESNLASLSKQPSSFARYFKTMLDTGVGAVLFFLLILFASSVSSELSSGTIKALIISPVKRYKIFAAKLVSLLLVYWIYVIPVAVLSFLLSWIAAGNCSAESVPLLIGTRTVTLPAVLYLLLKYAVYRFATLLCLGSFSLVLSVLTRNTAVSVGVSMLGLFGSNISLIASMLMRKTVVIWALPYVHMDWFERVFFQPDNYEQMRTSFGVLGYAPPAIFSLLYIALLMTAFIWVARDGFCRKDIQ